MKSFFPSLYKFILGMFLLGLALWVKPLEVKADGVNSFTLFDGSVSVPSYANALNGGYINLNDDTPIGRYGLVSYSSFKLSFDSRVFTRYIDLSYLEISSTIRVEVQLNYNDSSGRAFGKSLGFYLFDFNLNSVSSSNSFNFTIDSFCDGIPTGLRLFITPYLQSTTYLNVYDTRQDLATPSNPFTSYSVNVPLYFESSVQFFDFNFDSSTGGSSSSTVINNTTSNLVPIGYSSLNFGLNGSTYFLGAARIFEPSYLSPMMFSYDFANSVQGVVSSAPLTLAMGGYDSPPNTAHASPIAVIGDTRAGEYELTIALCLSNSPTDAQLSALTTLSNWGFEFNRGYSGQQFSLPSNTRVSYTNFTDSKTGYVYTSVYFYFTTPDYFDSFLIRKAPTLNNIRVGAFAFNKYTGTISDQLTQSNQQWDYQNPSHSSFSSANSSAASTVSAFSSIEADAFNNLDTAMSGAGVNDFNINVISTPLATVSGMINQVYNILPDLVKWLLLAILVIGFFAVIISSHNYVSNGD